MTLNEGNEGAEYIVADDSLPEDIKRRMEALGLTFGTKVKIMHKKKNGTLVMLLRGTRFAVGRGISSAITVAEVHNA